MTPCTQLGNVAYHAGEKRAATDDSVDRGYFPTSLELTRGTMITIIRAAYPDLWQPAVSIMLWRRRQAITAAYRAGYHAARYRLLRTDRTMRIRIMRVEGAAPKGA